jgi:DNA processing protein
VASEHPPGTPALPHHFPKRNRLLAALSEAVVVVEAAARSGALITAREAVELGRDVLAVPGPVDSPTSRGTNALLRDGAALALDAASVLAALGLSGLPEQGSLRPAPPERLGTDAAAVWQELEAIPRSVDDLARVVGLDAATALSALTRLELAGWARQSPGMRFQRRDA